MTNNKQQTNYSLRKNKILFVRVTRNRSWLDSDEPGFEHCIFGKVKHLTTDTIEDSGQKIIDSITKIGS